MIVLTRMRAIGRLMLLTALGSACASPRVSYRDGYLQLSGKAEKSNEMIAAAHFKRGSELYREGKLDEAAGHLEKALEAEPKHIDALEVMGEIRLKQGEPMTARQYFERVLKLEPGHAGALQNMASACLALRTMGERAQAVSCFSRLSYLVGEGER